MKILIVVPNFPPEIGSAQHVYFDLAKAFVNKGHSVDVITSYPREYNLIPSDRGKDFPLEETIDGIEIHRCRYFAQRDNIVLRGLEHFLTPWYYFQTYKKLGKKFDVCLMYIPPLPLYYLARRIKKYDGTKSVLNFQDFHPQELTDVGVLKNPLWIKIIEYIEKQVYKNADYITVLSRGGIDYVVNRGGNPAKIAHIYNGVLLSQLEPFLAKKEFKKKEGIEGKLLVSYAGILSPFQGVDVILDAAKQLQDDDDIVFYIVGDGMMKEQLHTRVKEESLSNVKILPFQSREDYYDIINSSDISLVSLDERMTAPCLPGKLINLMALKRPIIAAVPPESETAHVIREADCGIIVQPQNSEELTHAVMRLIGNRREKEQFGENCRKFLEENMNLEKNVMKYEEIFRELI